MTKGFRALVLSGCVSGLLFGPAAAVAGNKATVQLGADGTIQVQKGNKKVNVTTDGVQVEKGDKKVNVTTDGVDAETGSEQVNVTTGAGNVNVDIDGDEATVESDEGDSGSLVINGSDRNETFRCSGGTEVSVNGSDNNLQFQGECGNVIVSGSDNNVNVEAAAKIVVSGTDNKVSWKRGVGRSKPKVVSTGMGNKVKQAK